MYGLECGEYGGTRGPARDIIIKPCFFDVKAEAGAEFSLKVRPEDNLLCCVFEGGGCFDKEKTRVIKPGQLAVLEGGGGLACSASKEGLLLATLFYCL